MARRRRGGRRGRAVVACAVLAVLTAGVVAARLTVAEHAAVAALAARGISDATLRVARLDPLAVRVEGLTVGPEGVLVVDVAEARLSWDGLRPRIDEVRIEGARLQATIGDDGQARAGGLERLITTSADGAGSSAVVPARIVLDDLGLSLASPWGKASFAGGGRLDLDPDGRPRDGAIRLDLVASDLPGSGLAAWAEVAVRAGALSVVANAKADEVRLAAARLAAADVALDLHPSGAATTGTVRLALGAGSGGGGAALAGPLALTLAADAEGQWSGALAETPVTVAGLPAALRVAAGALRLAATPVPRLSLSGGRIAADTPAIALADLEATVVAGNATLSGRIVPGGAPPALAPLPFAATLEAAGGTLALAGTVQPAGGLPPMAFRARHDTATGNGSARIELPRTDLGPPVDLAATAPGLLRDARGVAGAVAARLNARWTPGAITTGGEIAVTDLFVDLPSLSLVRANGVVRLDNLWPPATPPGQTLAFAGLDLGVALTDGRITFGLARDGTLDVAEAHFALAGGTVALRERRFVSTGLPLVLTLDVDGLDLGRLLALANMAGLDGTGTLKGTLPVRLMAGGVEIPQARLSAVGPGTLRYAPAVLPPALQGDDPKIKLAVAALRDFRYRRLVLTLDRRIDGEATLGLSVAGRNPEVYEGIPIEFNLNLSGRLDAIARSALAGWQVPDDIRRTLDSYAEPAQP